jgi:hypothetical protein
MVFELSGSWSIATTSLMYVEAYPSVRKNA